MTSTVTASGQSSVPTSSATSSPGDTPSFTFHVSSTLILAILTTIVCVGTFVCMLLIRRHALLVYGAWRLRGRRMELATREAEVRGWASGVAVAGETSRTRKVRRPLGPKPALWDLQSIPLVHAEDSGQAKIAAMEPLSVQFIPLLTSVERANTAAYSRFEIPRSWIHAVKRRFEVEGEVLSAPHKARNTAQDAVAELYITVAISMPVPVKRRDFNVPLYELGVMTVPWNMEQASALGFDVDEPSLRADDVARDTQTQSALRVFLR
ncbi:hypothetical protein BC835DRAFT_1411675 [Cytidiella melzeri]|nr:hypothetical protein BC835DRAFT_1411675 [Cytidiella melzeri]